MKASSWKDAYAKASQDLIRLIDALHVVLQCVFSIAGCSWFVWRQYNGNGIMVANIFRPNTVVPITLSEDKQFTDIRKLRAADEAALLYFRESSRASTAKTRLAMLASTAEALAGDAITIPKCDECAIPFLCPNCQRQHQFKGTDKEQLTKILGSVLYKRLYKGDGIRHRLMHGSMIEEAEASDLATAAYGSVRNYLQDHLGLQSEHNIHNGPRPLDGSLLEYGCIRLAPSWLPTPFNPLNVDWKEKLQQLESRALYQFGEMIDLPLDL
jgi:hypothetical protein